MKMTLKKIAVILSSAILVAGTLFISAINTDINYSVLAEEGIPEGYTPVRTIEDLYGINNNLSGKYILMNDIDMTEDTAPGGDWDINDTGWEPIGAAKDNVFNGIFDGNGYAIIGMDIHGDCQYYSVGLFSINTGEIKNLKLIDVNFNITSVKTDWASDYSAVGAICGGNGFYNRNYDPGKIISCFVSGEINVDNAVCAGGIVGYGDSSYDCCISDCYNLSNINTNSVATYIGGISGYTNYYIENCYNIGHINGEKKSAISCSHSYPISDNFPRNCYYLTGTCEGEKSVSGENQAMSVAQMKSQSAFTGWDFKNTWVIDSTSSYKYPQLQSCMQVPVTEIKITSAPEKKIYVKDEALDLLGGKILVSHKDGSSGELEIDESMISGYNAEQVGKQNVLVNYLGKSAGFDVTVNPKSVSNLKISEVTENSVSISWDKVSSVNGYYVYKYDFENEKWMELIKVAKSTYIENVESLSSEYKYAVASYVSIDGVDYISDKEEVLKPTDFSLAAVTIDDIIYNGKTQTVVPQVLYNGKLLEEGVDFNIVSGDYEVLKCGDYSLTLSGIGKFTGSITVDFKVYCEHDWDLPDNNGICSICGESKYVLGDANMDGEVNEADSNYIISMISQGKCYKFTPCADYDGDSYYTPSDAYLIYSKVNDFTPFKSNNELLIEANYMGGAPGEKVPVMIFSTKGKFAAYNFTITLDPELEISYISSETPTALEADKNITVSSYINENSITFTGYSNNGTTINGNYMLIGSFYVTIPESAPNNYTYDVTFDNEAGGYAGGANDNTKNFNYKNGTVVVAMPLLGDVDADSKITLYDAIIVCKCMIGSDDVTDEQEKNADVNGDGYVNLYDAIYVAECLLGKHENGM